MTSGHYSKELQCFATRRSSVLKYAQKIWTHRVNCSQARLFQSKISIRNAFNAKSITIKTTTGRPRSSIESSRHCRGSLKFETQDKLDALQKLAKVLGIYQEPALPPIGQSVTVNQVNFSGDNALKAARRLAFALAKLSHRSSPGNSSKAIRQAQTGKVGLRRARLSRHASALVVSKRAAGWSGVLDGHEESPLPLPSTTPSIGTPGSPEN
jgi:hypothetical protein